jgi:hypothetical protein
MQERTRQRLLLGLLILLVLLLAGWWYSGFSLDFMRFFASEPVPVDRVPGTEPAPEGCYYQQVQCIQAPCPPILICPEDGAQVSCDPLTQTVAVGAAASLVGSGGGGNYEWFSPDGTPTTGTTTTGGIGIDNGRTAPYTVTYSTPGTKKVTVQAPRRSDPAIIDSVACTIIVQ